MKSNIIFPFKDVIYFFTVNFNKCPFSYFIRRDTSRLKQQDKDELSVFIISKEDFYTLAALFPLISDRDSKDKEKKLLQSDFLLVFLFFYRFKSRRVEGRWFEGLSLDKSNESLALRLALSRWERIIPLTLSMLLTLENNGQLKQRI